MAAGDVHANLIGVETVMQQICKNLTRWVRCTVFAVAAILSFNAWGLSLGHITLDSRLNQPLQASIALENVQGLTPRDVRIGLASKAAFDAIGVDWSSSLDDLGFVVVSSRSGLKVELSTEGPVIEPYLNFVLELVWPNGRLVREYTVLLDPPVLLASDRVLEIAPVQSARTAVAAKASSGSNRSIDADRMTRSGDTLWEIALAERPDRATSVQAMMLAILSRNPEAFIDQNINRLKAGYVLVMPDRQDLGRFSFESAVAEVASQNSEQQKPSGQKKKRALQASVDSELVLVAVDAESADNLASESGEVLAATEVAQDLADDLDPSAAIERDVLAARLASLESKLERLASTVSLKDQQILALQKQLKSLEDLPEPVTGSSFLTPVTIALMVALVVLVVVLLLMSARYQRLTRGLRASSAGTAGVSPKISNTALADTRDEPSGAPAQDILELTQSSDASSESGASISPDVDVDGVSEAVETVPTPSLPVVDAVNEVKGDEAISALADVQDEDTFAEIDLSELEGLDDLSELEELDLSDLSEPEVAVDLDTDLDEDPGNMLDLARAYVEMGDAEAARKLLVRVSVIGAPSEVAEAEEMLITLSEG